MPKVLILVTGESDQSSFLAECAGEGAKSVRFTEVDVRPVGSREPAELRDYDGVVVASDGRLPQTLVDLLDACESDEASEFANTVFAVVGFVDVAAVLQRIARIGGIIVSEPNAERSADEHAVLTGKRVAKVVGWVRHALSHEHGHHHHAH